MLVGGFLGLKCTYGTFFGLPHACGGVSDRLLYNVAAVKSSPCLWGCFSAPCSQHSMISVFPMLGECFYSAT